MANVSEPVIIQFEVSMSQLVKVVSAELGAAVGCGPPRSLPQPPRSVVTVAVASSRTK